MSPYLDGGFLLALIAKLPGSQAASQILRGVPAPVQINFLHQLQAENLLIRFQKSSDPAVRAAGNQGFLFWRRYLDEGVFTFGPMDWESGFRNAITWNRMTPDTPPSPWLFLHPALALASGTTHFLSFDPRTRLLARAHGIKLRPETL